MLTVQLSACAEKADSGKTGDDTVTGDAAVTEITWWAFPTFSQKRSSDEAGTYERSIIAAFEKENSNIHVNFRSIDFTTGPDRIDTALHNGTICDVLLDAPGRIIAYGKAGELVDIRDMFTPELVSDVDNAALLNACMDEDAAYMYPLSSAPFYMAFNRTMAEDAGVADLIREGWTTEDFTAVLQALKARGYVPGSLFYAGTGGDQATRAFVANLYSGSITDESATAYTINSASGVKALEYVKNCVNEGLLTNGVLYNGSADIRNFVNGESAFTLLWGSSQQNSNAALLTENQIEPIEVPFPSDDGTPTLEYLVNGFCVFDHQDAARVEASKKFIAFLCDDAVWGPQNVIQTGCIPVRSSYGDLYGDTRMRTIASWTKYYAPYYNTIDHFTQMRISWSNLLLAVLQSGIDPTRALNTFSACIG
ncbi:MAG: ABC transporter substrate-binding protein [Oscillospiraceae bacterium]|nr:ABC transporter substrate-binding protein [Oscillospiraceae bacterium]